MSVAQPHDSARSEGGCTVFVAELPAFAAIGRRYDELYRAYYEFRYSREHVLAEQAFARAIEEARDLVRKGDPDWHSVEGDLEARYGEKYRRLRSGIHPMFLKAAEASPAGLGQLLDMLAVGANGALARMAADSVATDDPAIQAAARWQPPVPPNPLDSPEFLGQIDQLKAADPVIGGRIADAMGGLLGLFGRSTDEEEDRRREDERMSALGKSPEMRQVMDQQRQVMEKMKLVNPGVARAMQRQLDEMEQMANDPAGFRAEWNAREEAEADEAGESSPLLPGHFRFDCGGVKRPTEHQERIFDRLVERQDELAPKVEKALRAMHADMAGSVDLDDPKERVLFSDDARASDIPLGYFRVDRFILPESGDRIGISFDSIFGHEEHGAALVIEGDEIADYGDTEGLFALEDEDDIDEDDFDDDEG